MERKQPMTAPIQCKPLPLVLLLAVFSGACDAEDLGPPPSTTLTASEYRGGAPHTVIFTVEGLEDSEYTVKRFEWDVDGDGLVDETTTPDDAPSGSLSYTFTVPGTYASEVKIIYNEADAWSLRQLESALVEDESGNPVRTTAITVL
jgi:hypothetical protein